MNDVHSSPPHVTASTPREAALDDALEPPSRVVPAILGVLAILPTLMIVLLAPSLVSLASDGSMSGLHLVSTVLATVLLPVGIALLFYRRRGAFTVFVLAILFGLLSLGSPFARIVFCGVMVSVPGAVVAWLRRAGR